MSNVGITSLANLIKARYNTLTRSNISLSQGTPDYPEKAKKSSLKIRE